MAANVERFSNRVENYAKFRPRYPSQMLELFRDEMGLRPESVIADIASGTGISSKPFLENGNEVFGIEPNDAMRAAAEAFLAGYPKFHTIKGTAEKTTLDEESVDIVIAAQAFHWFDPAKARDEFKRILKPLGYTALIWNERQLDTTDFHREYEAFLLRYGYDYGAVRHENVSAADLANFFKMPYAAATLPNFQIFDFDGLKGRMLSASYMPNEADAIFDEMIKELGELFAKHAENGKITVSYDTNIFYAQF